jgi:hypothetical protein
MSGSRTSAESYHDRVKVSDSILQNPTQFLLLSYVIDTYNVVATCLALPERKRENVKPSTVCANV